MCRTRACTPPSCATSRPICPNAATDLSQLLRSARRGKLQVQIDIASLKRLGEQLHRAATRMTIGIVTAALIIGSAIVMTVVGDPGFAGLNTLGLLGFFGAVAGGVAVLVSIWRGGRRE